MIGRREPKCLWCNGPVKLVYAGGGPYRGVELTGRHCERCDLTFMNGEEVAGLEALGRDDARRALLERKREPLRTRCPACSARVDEITFSSDAAWVTFEQCSGCRMLVLNRGELDRLRTVLG